MMESFTSQDREVQRSSYQVGEATLSVLSAGPAAGERIVLLHGVPAGAELWRDVIHRLASAGCRAYAPDLPGYGDTRLGPLGDPSLQGAAELLAHWLRSERLAPVWLVGHDLGGGTAQILAVQEPDLVDRLTLGDTVAGGGWPILPVRIFQILARLGLYSALAAARLVPNPYAWRELRRGFADPGYLDRATASRVFWDSKVSDPQGRAEFARHLAALDPGQTRAVVPYLGRIEAPALLLWGMQDRFQPWETTGLRLQSLLRAPAAVVLEGAGHFAPLERPEAYVRALLAWRLEASPRRQ